MELRILATFEDRNMLSLIFRCVKNTSSKYIRHFLEAMLTHPGSIFCPEVEIYKRILGPGRFNVANSA